MSTMLNFSVGPVMTDDAVREIGSQQVPYFRTAEFSATMLDNERMIKKLAHASADCRAVFLTGSGTAGMEAAVINTLDSHDKAIVVNGGSFGQRFCELCSIHEIPFVPITPERGCGITANDLAPFEGAGYTAFLVNLDETSTGVLYDLNLIADFCKRNNIFLIVDAISAFLADPIDFDKAAIGIMIVGSQKALAVPPGVSALVISPTGLDRIATHNSHCMYLDLKRALTNGERGQTPFTPAVGVLLQLHERLSSLEEKGVDAEIARIADLANYFRSQIAAGNPGNASSEAGCADFPFELFSKSPTNAVTSLRCPDWLDAHKFFELLKDEYGIWVCPNGGDMASRIFRVGHIGALSRKDYDTLLAAMRDALARLQQHEQPHEQPHEQ